MTLGTLLFTLIGGIIIGLLGKWVAPGDRDEIPFWLVILCGIGGCLIGTFLYSLLFNPHTNGIDWWRHVWQVVAAAALVAIAAEATGRRQRR